MGPTSPHRCRRRPANPDGALSNNSRDCDRRMFRPRTSAVMIAASMNCTLLKSTTTSPSPAALAAASALARSIAVFMSCSPRSETTVRVPSRRTTGGGLASRATSSHDGDLATTAMACSSDSRASDQRAARVRSTAPRTSDRWPDTYGLRRAKRDRTPLSSGGRCRFTASTRVVGGCLALPGGPAHPVARTSRPSGRPRGRGSMLSAER
jgi:hypothetical protein